MFTKSIMAAAALLGALLLPAAASAQSLAFSAPGATNMRAGPGPDFPVIAQVVGGSRVNVIGCIEGYEWCDSVVQGYRGWISATRLEFPYAGRRVAVPRHYASFGAPIIGFDFGYWDRHYRGRTFFRDRDRWDRDWRHGRRHDWDRGRDHDRADRGRRDRDFEDRNMDERDRHDFADDGRRRGGDGDRDFDRRGDVGGIEVGAGDGEFRRGGDRGGSRGGDPLSPEGCIVAGDGGLVCPR